MVNPCWKVGYDTPRKAQEAMVAALKNGLGKKGVKPYAYRCTFCGKFHWGHTRPALK